MCRTIPKASSLTRCDKVLTNQQIQSLLKLMFCHQPTPVHLGIVNSSHRSIGMSRDLFTSPRTRFFQRAACIRKSIRTKEENLQGSQVDSPEGYPDA